MALEALDKLPRARLWCDPTPLEALPNLAEVLGAKAIHVKRDDCNGLAFGGNKVRQLEYYLGQAVAQDADTVLMTGAVQSNFVRTAAAACAKLKMDCHIQLEDRVPRDNPEYTRSGNVLLDELLGATLHAYPEGEDEAGADRSLQEIADKLSGEGKKPYIVHMAPGHPPLGALGYVDCARELVTQLDENGIEPDEIFAPSGSGNTHGGLLYGLRALGRHAPVNGVCVRRAADLQKPRIENRVQQIAQLLDEKCPVGDDDVIVDDRFLPPGYGQAGPETFEAISLAARTEALLLDPVYTGKTFAALINSAREYPGRTLLFVFTGGGPSIFGYGEELRAGIAKLKS